MRTPQAPSGDVAVLEEIAEWHDQVRREAGSAGAGYRAALQNLEKAVYTFAQAPQPERLDALLRSLGRMERSVAQHAGGVLRRGDRPRVRPLQGLTRHWVSAQPDAAVRIALALASIQAAGKRGEVGPIRGHLEPVACIGKSWGWGRHDDATVVWGGDSLIGNLCAVLERRVTEARAANLSPAPLSARFGVSAADIAEFLRDDSGLNDGRIADLIWAFGGLADSAWATLAKSHATRQAGDEQEPPNAYTLLKLALLPSEVTPPRGLGTRSWPRRPQPFESRPIALLHAGRMAEAIELAGRRLRVEGLPPLATDFLYAGSAARLEAALLIPVCGEAIGHLEQRVLQPPPDGGAT